MIQNKGFFLYFVGATIGRPLDSPKFQAGDQWSPLQKTIHRIGVILIRMYYDDHNPPHIHAIYGDDTACFTFDGEIFNGNIPKKQRKLVEAWIEIHNDELKANWKLAQDGEQIFKIEPLK